MISHVQILNFQAHELLRLKLGEHATTIVGSSDAGKSSIIRAFRWLAANKPAGDQFLRNGATEAEVKIKVDDQAITRRRSAKENSYSVDGAEFVSFGAAPPQRVQDVLNIDAVNFQSQHDPTWWFHLTPGEVAKELNRIVDLSLADSSMAFIRSMLRRAEAEHSVVSDRVKLAEEKQTELAWVPFCEADLKEVERLEEAAIRGRERSGVLSDLMGLADENRQSGRRLQQKQKALDVVLAVGQRVVEGNNRIKRLLVLVVALRDAQRLSELDLPQLPDATQAESARLRADGLWGLVDQMPDVGRLGGRLRELDEELSEMTDGEICPVCGNSFQ